MTITIQITEADAACLWADQWQKRELPDIVQELTKDAALRYRRAFPGSLQQTIEDFRQATAK